MKKSLPVVIVVICSFLYANILFAAADTWTQMEDFGGSARHSAVGFSIGSKGYIGTGQCDGGVLTNDFWEYDPDTETWAQKTNFGGTGRLLAVGLSIRDKGYIGMGAIWNPTWTFFKDFWEYDPASDTWTQKADFGGTVRRSPAGFSIGDKGYVGTGYYYENWTNIYCNDFWEYDPDANTWTQKADFAGARRSDAVGFSIGNKGYIGTGYIGGETRDFWEYDPDTDTWTRKADFGGTARCTAVGFSIGTKGYIGTGNDRYGMTKDFWEYDPAADTWTRMEDFGGAARNYSVGFSIANRGYIGTGQAGGYAIDFWEYEPTDSIPDQFTFTDQTDVEMNTTITSDTITVAGINTQVSISITGGTYSINGGEYTSNDGTVESGDTITVQQTSSESETTTTDATLTIGGISDTFNVTTEAASDSDDDDGGGCFIGSSAFDLP